MPFNIGPIELLVILIVALLVLGLVVAALRFGFRR